MARNSTMIRDEKTQIPQPQTPANNNPIKSDEDYYNSLKNESYKEMMNANIAASVAKDQALKYTQNTLNNNGYGNQGVSESTNLGITNNYQNTVGQNRANYDNALQSINQEQYQKQLQQNENNITSFQTLFSGAQNYGKEQLDDLLSNRQFASFDDDGKITWNEKEMKNFGMTDIQIQEFKDQYNMYASALESAEETNEENTNNYHYKDENIENTFGQYATNANFDSKIGNKSYAFEIGADVSAYGSRVNLSEDAAKEIYSDLEVGQIGVRETNWLGGCISFVLKNDKGNIVGVEATNSDTLEKNAEKFTELLKSQGYTVESLGGYRYKINGVEYIYKQNIDGSCFFVRP